MSICLSRDHKNTITYWEKMIGESWGILKFDCKVELYLSFLGASRGAREFGVEI